MLVELVPGQIWHAESPLTVAGLRFKTRMSVVRLEDDKLWIHSPIRPTRELVAELDAKGEVAYVCAPNRYHHFYLLEFLSHYPSAVLFLAPGLSEKRRDLPPSRVLTNRSEPEWRGELEQLLFAGMPWLNEVVWLHGSSKTLLLTDLCALYGSDASPTTRLLARALGVYQTLGVPRSVRLLVRDRDAARRSRDGILQWDFDRVVVAHEQIVHAGGKRAFRAAFSWLD